MTQRLYEAYLNWRLSRIQNAIRTAEEGFERSAKRMRVFGRNINPNDAHILQVDQENLGYLGRLHSLSAIKEGLVRKLSDYKSKK